MGKEISHYCFFFYSWSGNLKAQRNLGPVLSSFHLVTSPNLSSSVQSSGSTLVQSPVTPQLQSNQDDDAPPGSGGNFYQYYFL